MSLNKFKRMVNPVINYLGQKKIDRKFSKEPILIGGCGRSGTTLLLSIIGAHPHVYAIPKETKVFLDWKQKEEGVCPVRTDRIYRHMLAHWISSKADRWCEKTPRNVRYFDEILSYFDQEVKLIHIIRDGRDVMLSKHPLAPDEYWISPERWVRDVKVGLKFKNHPQVLTIKYEDLILSYRETIEEICDFIGEESTEELYSWVDHTNVQDNKAWDGTVKELHTESIGKWQRKENKARVEEVMQHEEVRKLLEELGYKS
jgi:hypothetical protein